MWKKCRFYEIEFFSLLGVGWVMAGSIKNTMTICHWKATGKEREKYGKQCKIACFGWHEAKE